MTAVSIIAAAILSLARVGDARADRHADVIVRASSSVETAALLTVIDDRESSFEWDVERCKSSRGDGRGAFQLESGWGSLTTRCGTLARQARAAAFAVEYRGCDGDAACQLQRYAGWGHHEDEVAYRLNLVAFVLRRIEAKQCVL